MAVKRDESYRLLFSYPIMIEWLVRRFMPGDWLQRLDFSRLKKVSERDVSPELIRREKDLLWHLPYVWDNGEEEWFYLYLHFEFQSQIEPIMAVREMVYKGLLYLDLERQNLLLPGEGREHLPYRRCRVPTLLSSIDHDGEHQRQLAPGLDLSELPPGFLPDSYVVVDGQAYPFSELERNANPVTTLFQAEKSRGFEDLRQAVLKVGRQLESPEYRNLRRDFATVFRQMLIPALAPGLKMSEIDSLTEVSSMLLQEKVIEWRNAWVAEGEAKVLTRLAEKKFGPLPESALARIASASADQLLSWAERILTAKTLTEVFE